MKNKRAVCNILIPTVALKKGSMEPKVATTPGMVEEDEAPGPVKVDDLPIKWYQDVVFALQRFEPHHDFYCFLAVFNVIPSVTIMVQRSI